MDTIVFDLDGTLLNTLEDLTDSVNYALTVYNLPTRTIEEVRAFVGNGVRKLVERAVPQGFTDIDGVLAAFSKYYDVHKNDKTAPYAGVLDMLDEVKSAGYKTAIVSNKYDRAVKSLTETVFKGRIQVGIGERAGVAPKPAPDGVYAALEALHTDKENAVYIGDSDVDVLTAKNAGLFMIGVTWGFRDRALLEASGADAIIDSPHELINVLKKFK